MNRIAAIDQGAAGDDQGRLPGREPFQQGEIEGESQENQRKSKHRGADRRRGGDER